MQLKKKVRITLAAIIAFASITSMIVVIVLMEKVSTQVQYNFYKDFFKYVDSEVRQSSKEIDNAKLLNEIAGLESLSSSIEYEIKQKLLGLLTSFHFGQTGHFYIIDQNNEVISHTDENDRFHIPVTHPDLRAMNEPVEISYKQEDWLVAYHPIDDWQWVVVAQARKDELFEDLNSIIYPALAIFIAIAIVANIILISFFANIGVRLKSTLMFLRQIRGGDYSGQLEVHFDDELGELEEGINSMVSHVISRTEQLETLTNQLEKSNSQLEVLATSDGLTGLANRREFDNQISRLWSLNRRESNSLCLVIIDIDFFKQFNDHYGHVEGDECLKRISSLLCEAEFLKRPGDLVARYGGEEFVILMSNPTREYATRTIESIMARIRYAAIPHRNRPDSLGYVTISAGVNLEANLMANNIEDLIRKADSALYQAKSEGRNTYVFSGDAVRLALSK